MAFRSFGRAGVCADTGINGHVRAELLAVNKSARWRRWSKAGAFGLPALLSAAFMTQTVSAADAEASDRRQIEEVVVTAERKESTVSDTSISITAFTGQMLEDFGIRNQEDLQKYIPAAVIEPYDMAIRGIGRNFRALGGDPGIATYLNGVYSEDFGIASTEGGLFDIERIEVLRGPQGTLYGRNAIGGAVNFINRLPSNEFEGVARVVAGNYDLVEQYGVLSGPLIENILQARIVGTKRTRDGYIDDKSGNQNPDNYGDENYALSLRWTPTDNLEFNTRGNERSYRRRMGGADAAGIVNLTENGGTVDPVTGNKRNTSSFAMGYRAVDTSVVCPSLVDRTNPACTVTGATANAGFQPGGTTVYNFTDPVTGAAVTAQRVTPGVDFGIVGANQINNQAFGTSLARQKMLGNGKISGGDVQTDTSGHQDEYFDQQANSTDIRWTVNDTFSIKYIFGYTDYFYDRTSDTELTSNTNTFTPGDVAGVPVTFSGDRQFYVSQETEYISHELQFFNDWTDSLTTTTGLFYYKAAITQRGDFYNSNDLNPGATPGVCCAPGQSKFVSNFDYGAAAPIAATAPGAGAAAFMGFVPKVDLFTAKQSGLALRGGVPSGLSGLSNAFCFPVAFNNNPFQLCAGQWAADNGDRVAHGPITYGTNLEYQTRSEREAFAVYTQSVYTLNEHFALTLGARWARDQLHGEENLFTYVENLGFAGGNLPSAQLTAMNVAIGAMDANGQVLDYNNLRTAGLPVTESLWRQLYRKDDAVTGRINLDWTPNDKDLLYFSVTSGHRAGGFNLVFFSQNAKYKPEELIAYEIGYKGELLDGTMQVNSAIYFYDYENVHTFAASPSALGGSSTSVFAVPKAQLYGWDTDVLWLVNQRITLGIAGSYTHSEYTEDFDIIDTTNPSRPESLFDPLAIPLNIKGNQMLRVPKYKADAYAQYAWPVPGDRGTLTGLIGYSYIDKVSFSQFQLDIDKADYYTRADARLTWLSADSNWTVAAFCNNMFDDIGIRQIEASDESQDYRRGGTLTNPRTYGLEVIYKFGAYK
jgi:outer membrane receptor protein involved in Fe transport